MFLLFTDLSFVDAHQQREQSIYVVSLVGSLSWYSHLVCGCIYFYFHLMRNFMKYTNWNRVEICLLHSEFCALVYFLWFVHSLFGTTHWISWYAIYTNFHNLVSLTLLHPSTCFMFIHPTHFCYLCYRYSSSCKLENTELEGTSQYIQGGIPSSMA